MVAELKQHTDEVNCVAFSTDGQWLASVSDDNSSIIWKLSGATTTLHTRLVGHTDWVSI